MDEIPTIDLDFGDMPTLDLSFGDSFFQIILLASLLFTVIFTLILLVHWKKYSPNPLKTFMHSVIYLAGTAAIVIAQLTFLSLY